ncbi:hypothetical protein [Streptomyces brevispora]|uniref:hypothetical protein n=1 Tax=Streptomyces brevispora TaxID=887462 RepID=UPI0035D87F5C
MDWTKQAQHDFQNMPAEGSDPVMSARAKLVTAQDPYLPGNRSRCLAPALDDRPTAVLHEPRRPHIVDLAGGRGWPMYTFMRHHAAPQIVVTEAFWA